MLRSGYSSEVVLQELSKRRFADTLDSAAETQLAQAGASQDLINTLQSGVYQLSAAETAAFREKLVVRPESSNTAPLQSIPSAQPAKNKGNSASSGPPVESQIGGTMYDHFKGDLVYWHDGSLMPYDDEVLAKKKYYLLFFSAFGSKEGRLLTTQLSDYYNRVAPQHPEFEIVFCSVDRSAFAMETYISQTNMPWPAVAYDKRGGKAGATQENLVKQIPHLILADVSGKILSDSGQEQPDFDKVINDLNKILAR